jgi:O-antigen/teichoic acid export membrane protein
MKTSFSRWSTVRELLRSRIARNSVWNLFGLAIPLLVGIALVPVTMRGLGAARYGLLSLALTVLEYSTLFALGLGPATTKHVASALARNDETAPDLAIMSMIGHTVMGAIAGLVVASLATVIVDHVFSVSPALHDEAVTVFRLLGLMVPATFLLLSLFGALEGASRFGLVNLLRVPISALSFIIPAWAVTHGIGLPTILVALVVLRLFICGILLVVVSLSIPGYRWRWPRDWHGMRALLSFGAWLSVSNLVSPTLVYADRFLLGHLRGLAAVGLYAAPFDAVMRLLMFPGSLVRAMFPTLSAMHTTEQYESIRPLYRKAVLLVLLLLCFPLVLLLIFGPRLVGLWLGPQVAAASGTAVRVLAAGLLFNGAALIPTTFIAASGRPDISAKFHLIELPIHLPLAWWLVSRFGITGAATAWSIRVVIDSLLLFSAARLLMRGGSKLGAASGPGLVVVT